MYELFNNRSWLIGQGKQGTFTSNDFYQGVMQHILILLLFTVSSNVFAQTREAFNNLNISEDKVILASDTSKLSVESTLAEVHRIDDLISTNNQQVELMAITQESDEPVKVFNGEWPDMVEVAINILRRPSGQIYYYAEYPMSESGDWFIGYAYYFDNAGKVIAFKRTANFFNSGCTDGVAMEKSIYTFDQNHNLTSKSYSLTDSKGLNISNKLCWFNYDYKYIIGKTTMDVEN